MADERREIQRLQQRMRNGLLRNWPWVEALLSDPTVAPKDRRAAQQLVRKYGRQVSLIRARRARGLPDLPTLAEIYVEAVKRATATPASVRKTPKKKGRARRKRRS